MKCKSKIFAPPPSDGFLIVTSRATRCRVLADNTKLFERGEGEASSDGANVEIGFRSRRKPPAPLSLQELNDTRTGRELMFAVYIQMWHIPSQTQAISCRRMVSCPLQQLGYSYIHGFLHDRPKPWLIVGLGNPGQKFEGTRHNVGFEMIDSIAQTEGISINTTLCKALCGKGHIGNTPVLLAKPQTFMDLSGESMFDDMELPCGILRLNQNGGHGGHNGVKSVMQAFKKIQDFARLRIGIGKPPGNMDPKAYLLQTYNSSARETVNIALKEGVEAARLLTSEGFFESARHFNLKQKYKHQKVDYLGFGRKNC